MPTRTPPLVLGMVRGVSGHEHELVLRRDGSVSCRCLSCGRVWDGLCLAEVSDWLRLQAGASS